MTWELRSNHSEALHPTERVFEKIPARTVTPVGITWYMLEPYVCSGRKVGEVRYHTRPVYGWVNATTFDQRVKRRHDVTEVQTRPSPFVQLRFRRERWRLHLLLERPQMQRQHCTAHQMR